MCSCKSPKNVFHPLLQTQQVRLSVEHNCIGVCLKESETFKTHHCLPH